MTLSAAHQRFRRRRPSPLPAADDVGRVEEAFRRARRHSEHVRTLKVVLPALAALMVVIFVARSWLSTPDGVAIDLGGTAVEDGRLVMSDPKLDGFTKDNRAYSMTAQRAIQDIGDATSIDLEGISARLPFEVKNWVTITAEQGTFNREANTLDIDSNITATSDTGVTAVLQSALVDIGAGSLSTDNPVDIALDGARIMADSMTVTDRGAVLLFEDRVRVEIDAKKLQTARAEGEPDED